MARPWRTYHKRAKRPRIVWKDFARHMRLYAYVSKEEMQFVIEAAKRTQQAVQHAMREMKSNAN